MQIKLEACPICENNDWESLDHLRDYKYWYERDFLYNEPVAFKICKECGFLTYDYQDDQTLKERYERMRKIVDVNCIITANRKVDYHKLFLKDIELKGNFLDYGCGTGYFLNLMKSFDSEGGDIDGIELNEVQRKYAMLEYGHTIYDKIPDKKYGLISAYHVLEHLQYPDKMLQEFREHLDDEGYLYISVPVNLRPDILDEASGIPTVNFEEFYHLNHVNVFSYQSLKNMLHKAGFIIVKTDDQYYGYTVLCQKAEPQDIVKEEYHQIIEILTKQKKAIELFNQEKFKEATEVHSGYIDAWIAYSMKEFKDLPGQKEKTLEAMKATNNHYKIKQRLAQIYYMWDENKKGEREITNHVKEAKRLYEELIIDKPGYEDNFYFLAMLEVNYFKNYMRARELFARIIEINPTKYGEIMSLVGWCWKSYAEDNKEK